ncbi:hypothetical protein, partial [Barnesiella sp.]|uniref:hypothetical protein n=1 Tax=Barnesiella sp. TaxID=2033407 RepID=UPI0025900915
FFSPYCWATPRNTTGLGREESRNLSIHRSTVVLIFRLYEPSRPIAHTCAEEECVNTLQYRRV